MTKWEKIRERYVNGNESTRELAQAFGVGVSAVSHRCANGGWVAMREAAREAKERDAWAEIGEPAGEAGRRDGSGASRDDMRGLVDNCVAMAQRQLERTNDEEPDIDELYQILRMMNLLVDLQSKLSRRLKPYEQARIDIAKRREDRADRAFDADHGADMGKIEVAWKSNGLSGLAE